MGLRVRATTIKILEESIGVYLHGLGLDNGFLNAALKAQWQKEKYKLSINNFFF